LEDAILRTEILCFLLGEEMPDVRFIASSDRQCQETFPLSSGYLPVFAENLDVYLSVFPQSNGLHSGEHHKA